MSEREGKGTFPCYRLPMATIIQTLHLLAATLCSISLLACQAAVADEPHSLTHDNRAELVELRAQNKFQPDLLSGYTGADLPEDVAPLNAAVNNLIDALLAQPDGPVSDGEVRGLVAKAINEVDLFATEDRERAYRYIRQVWNTLGFEGDPLIQPR